MGAFPEILMAADTLCVKCIRAFHDFRIFNFRFIMALKAGLRRSLFLSRELMAVFAGQNLFLVFFRMMMAFFA